MVYKRKRRYRNWKTRRIRVVNQIYDEVCVNGEDSMLARHYFGKRPELLGIFYNLKRGQVNYQQVKKQFEEAVSDESVTAVLGGKKAEILNAETQNFIDTARQAQNGEAAKNETGFRELCEIILEKLGD